MLKRLSSQYLSGLYPSIKWFLPSLLDVTKRKNVVIQLPSGKRVTLDGRSLGFAARAVNNEKMGENRIRRGSVIRVRNNGGRGW